MVKSVIVPAANIVSNMFQLLNRGVPLRSVLKGTPAKTAELNRYIKNRSREISLEADLRAAEGKKSLVDIRKIGIQLQSIQDAYRRMSIWPLIEAGEFSAISNGQVTQEDLALADGKWTNWVERKVAELPDGLRTAATLRSGHQGHGPFRVWLVRCSTETSSPKRCFMTTWTIQ